MNRSAILATLAVAVLGTLVLPGCITRILDPPEPRFSDPLSEFEEFQVPAGNLTGPLSASAVSWPRFEDEDGDCPTLRILDHGAFAAFEAAATRFTELTCAHVEHDEADDTGDALRQARDDRAAPQYDVLYGIDNALLGQAMKEGEEIFQPYTPQLASRVMPQHVFFADAFDPWPATPVDHGYVAINWDPTHRGLANASVVNLHDLVRLRDRFVTEDPRTSTPGLGFLLLTIGRFGEEGGYTWRHYWGDLLERGNATQNSTRPALVVADWATAYEKHFSGGYGWDQEGHLGDKPIVTSYTESPAYEWYWDEVYPRATEEYDPGYHYKSDPARLPRVLLDPEGSVFQQVQTMGVLAGARNRAVAEAWIEFTLTDDFQRLAAKENAVYPVVASVGTDDVYTDKDPSPGPFVIDVPWFQTRDNLERWLQEWTALCEQHDCA